MALLQASRHKGSLSNAQKQDPLPVTYKGSRGEERVIKVPCWERIRRKVKEKRAKKKTACDGWKKEEGEGTDRGRGRESHPEGGGGEGQRDGEDLIKSVISCDRTLEAADVHPPLGRSRLRHTPITSSPPHQDRLWGRKWILMPDLSVRHPLLRGHHCSKLSLDVLIQIATCSLNYWQDYFRARSVVIIS